MFNVGIIGSDNSHALIFSKLTNIPDEASGMYAYPDVRITGIFGLDKKRTAEVAEEGRIERIYDNPEDMLGKVDAVMVVFRHGGLHARYALPFIQAGIPTWIDKPFVIEPGEGEHIIECARKHHTLITGGSTCKYAEDVLFLKNEVTRQDMTGNILSGALNFPADLQSAYGGLFFYGTHLAEMMLTIFGYDVRSVVTSKQADNLVAIAKYDRYQVNMNFLKQTPRYLGILYGDKGNVVRGINIASVYRQGMDRFVEMLRTQKCPFPPEQLLTSVVLLNCIEKSVNENREVFLREFEPPLVNPL